MSTVSVLAIAAAPFEGGALLAALPPEGRWAPCVLKGSRGLVTGIGLPQPVPLPVRRDDLSDWPWSEEAVRALPAAVSVFLSREGSLGDAGPQPGEPVPQKSFLGEPIRLYGGSGGQLRRVFRASLLAAPSVPEALSREAGLKLQWELDRGTSLEVRMRGLVVVLGWLAEELGSGRTDCEVGIHEPDLHYSVDRVSWREL